MNVADASIIVDLLLRAPGVDAIDSRLFDSNEPLLNRIWMLRHTLTAYDAAYVALAEGLNATLCTRDAPLSLSKGHTARIELV